MNAKKSIAYKMTVTVVFLTLLIGLVLGTIQVAWDYQQRVGNLYIRVNEVLNSIEKPATKAVYTFDTDLASEVAAGLFEFQPISSVRIMDEDGKVMTNMIRYRGDLPYQSLTGFLFNESYPFNIPLKLQRDTTQVIGSLSITVTPHDTVSEFLKRAITTLTAAFLESFLISTILLFVFFRRVTRPLHRLANDFTLIDPEAPEKSTLTVDDPLKSTEFEEVVRSGNNMLNVIGSQLRAKDKAEAELKRQKNETERYLKIAEAIILQLDKSGKIIMMNQRGLDVMGYELNEVLGQDWFKLAIPEENHKAVKKTLSAILSKTIPHGYLNKSSYFENEILTKSGQKRRIFWHNALEVDRFGEATGILSSGQDITERKEAEEALRATEGSLRAIIEATSEGFAITDLVSQDLLDVNSAFHQMLGYNRNDVIGQPVAKFVNPADLDILKSNISDSSHRPHRSYEVRMVHHDGSNVPVEVNASNLPQAPGENPRSVAFITNITERKEQEESQRLLETQLRQAQKMETIGTLAGGIAHDFNNILTPILGYSSILSSRIDKDDPNHSRIQQIEKSANRAAAMVKQILTFSRRTDGEMEGTYISPVIKEAMTLVRSTIPANIDLHQHIPDRLPPIIADATQIQQLVLNLCTNASHAMAQEGGALNVTLKEVQLDQKAAQISPVLEEGSYLLLTISDTGHGMDEETLSRIFDPFYTTKKSGEGTGLGLAMVHGIVQNHDGDIFVESAPDKGSIFTVYLPVADVVVKEEDTVSITASGNQELVLVVDDERMNTDFIDELLDEVGYISESYTNSLAALDAFMQDPDQYQIILTDQTMPKLTGDQLVKAVREIRPDIPIIMMSGYDQNISHENAVDIGVDIYLQKPVSVDTLTNAMKKLLHPADVVG